MSFTVRYEYQANVYSNAEAFLVLSLTVEHTMHDLQVVFGRSKKFLF